MSLSPIKIIFSSAAIYTAFIGIFINLYQNYLPSFIVNTFLYGKYSLPTSNTTPSIKVPKRWFRHFYVFATIWSSIFLILTSFYYFHVIHSIPKLAKDFLSYFILEDQVATVSAVDTLLALFLITIQSYKRFYETHYVSVFSNAMMDISHYLIGLIHYFGTILAIVVESPGFSQSGKFENSFQFKDISYKEVVISLIFLWAWWNQLKSATILGNLRKNKKGEVVTQEHRIPYGGLFSYVSSPHSMCEIIMYLCLSLILFENHTFHYITAWVLVNQVETSILAHRWYKNKFKEYPKNRKALIPSIF
ncbi:hypothetical protein O3M35_006375 [Rhynocoris fuscipes]|uniref:Polyprenal reductase n=1 Tax=Rhynocoris fuscipes TaxID=488301 RepID=A0AAW1DGY4_9HEMI